MLIPCLKIQPFVSKKKVCVGKLIVLPHFFSKWGKREHMIPIVPATTPLYYEADIIISSK